MTAVLTFYRRHKRLKSLIDLAVREGWDVARTPGGHLKFVKPGLSPTYTSATASDRRAGHNAIAQLRRAGGSASPRATTSEVGTDD